MKSDLREKGFGRIRQMDKQRVENSRSYVVCMRRKKEEWLHEGIVSCEEGLG